MESLVLFESVINSRWFLRTSIILFLNKIDVFKSKLPKLPFERYFPDYGGKPIDFVTMNECIAKSRIYVSMQVAKISKKRPNISFGDSTKQIVPSLTFTHSKHMHHSFRTPYCIICSDSSLHSLTEATSTTNVSLYMKQGLIHPLILCCNHRFEWFLVL